MKRGCKDKFYYEKAVRRTMIGRCHNVNSHKYQSYGARGIKVCESWLSSFDNFIRDMGPRPSKDHSIERLDNNGNYEKLNCVWATREQQGANKRNSVLFSLNGKFFNMYQLAKILSIPLSGIRTRLYQYKEPIEVAVEHCLNYQRSKK